MAKSRDTTANVSLMDGRRSLPVYRVFCYWSVVATTGSSGSYFGTGGRGRFGGGPGHGGYCMCEPW